MSARMISIRLQPEEETALRRILDRANDHVEGLGSVPGVGTLPRDITLTGLIHRWVQEKIRELEGETVQSGPVETRQKPADALLAALAKLRGAR